MTSSFISYTHQTSYRLANVSPILPGVPEPPLYPEVLAVCKQIYDEASPILYRGKVFDFGADINAVAPFLGDLTPAARSMVTSVSITKRAAFRLREFDNAVWAHACRCLAALPALEKLTLKIILHDPMFDNVQPERTYSAEDFRVLESVRYEGLNWVRELLKIRHLSELEVVGETEWGIPSPRAGAGEGGGGVVEWWVAFSASLPGFEEYIKEIIVEGERDRRLEEEILDWGA
jgi:hypothetical protein